MGRREERRERTLAEIREAAIGCMADEGVAGLNLSEVARRVGMRTPSLYEYFPSKLAVYDDLFGLGVRRCQAAVEEAVDGLAPGIGRLAAGNVAFVSWCAANPVLAQLLFWRPVPGFEPSPASYAEARRMLERLREELADTARAGELSPDAARDEGLALYTALTQGVVSQHLANEPGVPFEKGRFTALLPVLLELFRHRYAPKEPR
ncbi:MAG TPA: TetR/AcrR family transcriptional regulator [Egibacteraceae bacterium]|nr:TetR/AcrR family transcriptional regulator [Egibacteraceae bacterium]